MSVYRPRRADGTYKSQVWHYDFELKPKGSAKSVRFHGSTGQKNKKGALQVETEFRRLAALGELASMMTVNQACCRYWEEVVRHQPSCEDTERSLEYIKRLLGAETLLIDVNSELISTAAARRAAEPVMVRRRVVDQIVPVPTGKVVSLSSVNRQIVEPIRRLLRRARKVWKVPVDLDGISWEELLYTEPTERVREMTNAEADLFWDELRPDYHPILRYYLISGKRRSEVIGVTKFDVDLKAMKVRYGIRKRNGITKVTKSLTTAQAAILREEMGKSPVEAVFTYEAQRKPDKGKRRPITAMGLKTEITRVLKRVGIVDFHPTHDLRHTFGSALLRAVGGNFELVRKALDHTDIKTTQKYAHVMDEEVVAGMEKLELSRNYPGAAFQVLKGKVEKL